MKNNMKTIQEQLKYLNSLEILQTADFMESIPEEVYTDCFEKAKMLDSGLNVSKHRWYETSIIIYETKYGQIGVREVSGFFSEEMDIESCMHKLKFFEAEEVIGVTYKVKTNHENN